MPKQEIGTYDPKIPPERQVLEERKRLIEISKGTDRCLRMGEEYFIFCHCGSYGIVNEYSGVRLFLAQHPHNGLAPRG